MTQLEGVVLLVVYFCLMMFAARIIKSGKDKRSFLVGNRSIGWIVGAFSLAATWVWAPSMFVASEKAYLQGIAGVFWFVVPNIATLAIFAFFADRMRKLRPEGWTFSEYIRESYSNRVHNLFLFESFGLQICSLAVQLLAGATIMHKMTGLPFVWMTVVLALIPLLYTFKSGITASILTDYWQMIWIVLVLLIGLPIILSNAGVESLSLGLSGKSGEYGSLFSSEGLKVALTFGLPTTIGLLSGTFGDQMFWQRVFSVKKGSVKKTVLLSSLIFGVVPISLAFFGFISAGAGLDIADTQLTNVGAVMAFAPKWFLWMFMVMILSGLISTVDSILCAVSSITSVDVMNRIRERFRDNNEDEVSAGRLAMILAVIGAIIIANIPHLTILYLFLFYGTLRSSVMLPSIFAIKGFRMSEKGLFWGILTSICIGLPVFAIGNIYQNTAMIVGGSLFTILASGIMALTLKEERK